MPLYIVTMYTLVATLAIVSMTQILADAMSCSSPNHVLNIVAVAAATPSLCGETHCDIWIKIEISNSYYSVEHDVWHTPWITLLEEHNDKLNADVTKQFNASIVFPLSVNIPMKYRLRVTVSDDIRGYSGRWDQRISNTKELFQVRKQITPQGANFSIATDYYIDEDTSSDEKGNDVAALNSRTSLEDVFNKRGSALFLRADSTDECLVNDCDPVDLRLVMRINAVVALKNPCDNSGTTAACDIWMKIEIGWDNDKLSGSKSADHKNITWRTMLEEHDSVSQRQVSRVFRGSTSFKNLNEMPQMYTLKITVRDDDEHDAAWSESFDRTEPVVEFRSQFGGPPHFSDIREGYRKIYKTQTPFQNRRRRGTQDYYKRYPVSGLRPRDLIQIDLGYQDESFVEFFISTEKECTTNSPNRYYLRNCKPIGDCHDYPSN